MIIKIHIPIIVFWTATDVLRPNSPVESTPRNGKTLYDPHTLDSGRLEKLKVAWPKYSPPPSNLIRPIFALFSFACGNTCYPARFYLLV